ncbi:MAG TPA: LCP family protein [Firmicutes bacterium]|nr:LCP family protein [Bacillota bacterium]
MYYSRSYLLQKPKRTARRKRKKLAALATLMLLVLAVVLSVNLISVFRSIHNRADWAAALRLQGGGDERVYLLYGIDFWGASPYVDRLVLLHHDTAHKTISLLYIPGNTLVKTEKGTAGPLGRLYGSLDESEFIAMVQELVGVAVHHYVAADYQGIIAMGDYLGGIGIEALQGEENAGEELLPKDREQLTGLALYRYFLSAGFNEPPWNQLKRQQKVLAGIWKGMEQKKFWQWPKMIRLFSPYLETDLSWRELNNAREELGGYDFASMEMLTLPGKEKVVGGTLCWAPDKKALKDVVRLLNEGYLVKPAQVRVEVLNGSGIEGLAAKAAALLEREGFEVVRTGNADHFNYTATEVIALGETVDKARAAALYLPGASMLHQHDPEAQIDVQVIIGSSYAEQIDNR